MQWEQSFPFLKTLSLAPENQESPIHFLNMWKTPVHFFYRRNHFPYPALTKQNDWLEIIGQVSRPGSFHYSEILSMPAKSLIVPLECAGNKRARFSPKVFGEQWEDGALSQGKWTGVPLKYLLEKIGLSENTKEIVFTGADSGEKPGQQDKIPFKRSLPLKKALHPDTLVAYLFNDQPLSLKHGYPFRLIVPDWYAMAYVKWLKKITVIDHTFSGPFQTEDYMYYPYKDNDKNKYPVTELRVNSTIQQPTNFSILNKGSHELKGIAWTGGGRIIEVQVSIDEGESWHKATLKPASEDRYSWVRWSFSWRIEVKGEYTIYSRAKDSTGEIQPLNPFWNRKGYSYNAISKINLKIE